MFSRHKNKKQKQNTWPYELALPTIGDHPVFYVLSASANNEHEMEVPAVLGTPLHAMEATSIRYTPRELRATLVKHFPNLEDEGKRKEHVRALDELLYCTACLPLRVAEVLAALREEAGPSLPSQEATFQQEQCFTKWIS